MEILKLMSRKKERTIEEAREAPIHFIVGIEQEPKGPLVGIAPPKAAPAKSRKDEFKEDLKDLGPDGILFNCLLVAGIAALAVLAWPVNVEMAFTAAKAFGMAFMVQLTKYRKVGS